MFIAGIYTDLANFSAVRHLDVGGMVKKPVIDLALGWVISGFNSPRGVTSERSNTKQDFEREGRHFAVACQAKLSAALANWKEVAESRIYSASKNRVARMANAVDGQAAAYREREYMLETRWTLVEAENATHW
jgi:hypothetical protein